jgi:hypothetical protein
MAKNISISNTKQPKNVQVWVKVNLSARELACHTEKGSSDRIMSLLISSGIFFIALELNTSI